MSDLEKLPTELLEAVFLYCMNLDLPRSSPVIAGKLSSELMYSRTVIAAFGPTWDRWHGQEQNRKLQKDVTDADPVLQASIGIVSTLAFFDIDLSLLYCAVVGPLYR
jgi:hypothetical protein